MVRQNLTHEIKMPFFNLTKSLETNQVISRKIFHCCYFARLFLQTAIFAFGRDFRRNYNTGNQLLQKYRPGPNPTTPINNASVVKKILTQLIA
jgi:hypothetical protein